MTVAATVERIVVTRYRCAICHRGFWKRTQAARHLCFHDPLNRACLTCRHDSGFDDDRDVPECMVGIRPANEKILVDCELWSPK